MKNTGIVRRIDELGRIVIPKEIRKVLRLSEGTQMEIYTTENGELVLKKFSLISDIKEYAEAFSSSLSITTQASVLVCDMDYVLACSNTSKKDFLHKQISPELEKLIKERKSYILNTSENATTYSLVVGDKFKYVSQIIVPIIVSSDIVGAIIMFSIEENSLYSTSDIKVVQTVANLFSSILE